MIKITSPGKDASLLDVELAQLVGHQTAVQEVAGLKRTEENGLHL